MPHAFYAREGNVVFRFERERERDAWLAAAPKRRIKVTGKQVSIRLQVKGVDGELELRDAPLGNPPRRR